jgi:hypothetical protein
MRVLKGCVVTFATVALVVAVRQLRLGAEFRQQAPPGAPASGSQAPPRFRAGVDIVETTAVVFDQHRKPVTGLSERDFEIFEDHAPRSIVAFSTVTLPPPAIASAPWMQTVASDVDSNTRADGRLVVILIDDVVNMASSTRKINSGSGSALSMPLAGGGGGRGSVGGQATTGPASPVYSFQQTKLAARRAIDALGPTDEAAVVFTGAGWDGQSFTRDHAKLLSAVERTRLTPPQAPACGGVASTDALLQATDALASIPRRMKVVLYVSAGPRITLIGPQSDSCAEQAQGLAQRAVQSAQLGNVLIYSVDPSGLKGEPLTGIASWSLNFLTDVSANTGARAILRTNEVASKMRGLLEETNSYYLLGYERSGPVRDGQFHLLDVRVIGHPEWQVSFRRLRQDPPAESSGSGLAPTEAAIEGFMSDPTLPISVSVAPFAAARDGASVQVALRITLPANAPVLSTDEEDLLLRAFTIDGRSVAQAHATTHVPVISRAITGDQPRVQQASTSLQMTLAPGRYALRIGVRSVTTGRVGSVYTDVTVPDFFNESLSISGTVLMASGSTFILRPTDLSMIAPIVARTFARDDQVQAFLRVYRGASAPAADATLRAQIVNSEGRTVFEQHDRLPVAAFANGQSANYFLRLPFDTLKPGRYCLTIDATSGPSAARRDVIFGVQ